MIQYAFTSQVLSHGLDPNKAILELSPREGEYTLREEDILKTLDEQGLSIALVLFSGVQYYTGQWFPIKSITRKAKEQVGSSHDLLESTLPPSCGRYSTYLLHMASACIYFFFAFRAVSAAGILRMQLATFLFACMTGTLISLCGALTNI